MLEGITCTVSLNQEVLFSIASSVTVYQEKLVSPVRDLRRSRRMPSPDISL
jgi:hypothetical protein